MQEIEGYGQINTLNQVESDLFSGNPKDRAFHRNELADGLFFGERVPFLKMEPVFSSSAFFFGNEVGDMIFQELPSGNEEEQNRVPMEWYVFNESYQNYRAFGGVEQIDHWGQGFKKSRVAKLQSLGLSEEELAWRGGNSPDFSSVVLGGAFQGPEEDILVSYRDHKFWKLDLWTGREEWVETQSLFARVGTEKFKSSFTGHSAKQSNENQLEDGQNFEFAQEFSLKNHTLKAHLWWVRHEKGRFIPLFGYAFKKERFHFSLYANDEFYRNFSEFLLKKGCFQSRFFASSGYGNLGHSLELFPENRNPQTRFWYLTGVDFTQDFKAHALRFGQNLSQGEESFETLEVYTFNSRLEREGEWHFSQKWRTSSFGEWKFQYALAPSSTLQSSLRFEKKWVLKALAEVPPLWKYLITLSHEFPKKLFVEYNGIYTGSYEFDSWGDEGYGNLWSNNLEITKNFETWPVELQLKILHFASREVKLHPLGAPKRFRIIVGIQSRF